MSTTVFTLCSVLPIPLIVFDCCRPHLPARFAAAGLLTSSKESVLLLLLLPAVTNASRTTLMELATLSWHHPTLQLFKAPPGIMPRIASNAEVYGHVAEGPLAGVPISGGVEHA